MEIILREMGYESMRIKKSLLEHEIETGIQRLQELRESGLKSNELYGFYREDLQLHDKFVDYILTVYHMKDHKINDYKKRIKALIN